MKKKLIGIDPGSENSGIIVIENGNIREGYNMANKEVFGFIIEEFKELNSELKVIIEDVKPYNMRITDGIIKTIKVIGEMEWRLKDAGIAFESIPRWQIKQWVFVQFKTLALPLIEKKIDVWALKEENKGKKRFLPQFVWIDDRIIVSAMRKHWGIEKVKQVGKKTPYSLKEHSWQALALVSYYIVSSKKPSR